MNQSIHNSEFIEHLVTAFLVFVKDKLELLMREELSNFLAVEKPEA